LTVTTAGYNPAASKSGSYFVSDATCWSLPEIPNAVVAKRKRGTNDIGAHPLNETSAALFEKLGHQRAAHASQRQSGGESAHKSI
jgi:hypothetical protein